MQYVRLTLVTIGHNVLVLLLLEMTVFAIVIVMFIGCLIGIISTINHQSINFISY